MREVSLVGEQGLNYSLFQIQAVRFDNRFQSSKNYVTFSGDNAVVVNDKDEAAWFHLDKGQLLSHNQYVRLDMSNGYSLLELDHTAESDGVAFSQDRTNGLQVSGPGFSLGKGQALYCVSEDAVIFAVATRMPPFKCDRILLRPQGKPHLNYECVLGTVRCC